MTHALQPHALTLRAEDAQRRLRQVLRANAASSAMSGLVMTMTPGAVDELLGTGHPGWVRLVGIGLLGFAAFVAWLSTASIRQLKQQTLAIVVGDVSWVVASAVTVVLGWYSSTGALAVGAMALVVDVLAGLQLVFWHRLRR